MEATDYFEVQFSARVRATQLPMRLESESE